MKSKWLIRNIRYDYPALSRELKLEEEICRCLINRGPSTLEEIQAYLAPDLDTLPDPGLLKDLDLAVDILREAIAEEVSIRLMGDYDIDGAMSIYVAMTALKRCGAVVDYDIPDRIQDGYGINRDLVKKAYDEGVGLLVTFDNGIAALDAVEYAQSLGMMVIVTDHHDVPFVVEEGQRVEVIPPADAVVNPKQKDCLYPFKALCGAGVAFKLITALYEEMGIPKEELLELIPFVAIATVGDIVDLQGENRTLVKHGLSLVGKTKNAGLRALAKACQVDLENLSAYAIGFVIGPCFNAAGRLSTAKKTVELLFMEDEEAEGLAQELYALNQTRRAMTEEGVLLAEQRIEEERQGEDSVMVIRLDDVHESLAGIIAGRVKERYYRPAIVLTRTEKGLKGSARSIEEYNMFEGLHQAKEHLLKFGGHPMAAGLTLAEENLPAFKAALNAQSQLTEEDLIPKVTIDARLNPARITEGFVRNLAKLEPFGKGNPKPVFAEKKLLITGAFTMGREKEHLKFYFNAGGKTVEGVYFFGTRILRDLLAEEGIEVEDPTLAVKNTFCDLLFYPDLNTYNGETRVQLKISDFRLSAE
ncbi:single-stranded-DNA-specific exonuclease RecJ [Proteiniclasticum sp. BAD-10]|uniref:Single-stranded-DNA-specific exonuclease RecJ n=1 Tax=Proteiniclasticum sediminis TaxID=2804028 RepID=A0A941HQL4_9CLOT|nr:single-stranded-DNA-specific exonuclease RecJ [Proteiniclasticum sediminis]MBR0575608.1 single-stranded-DNA-specific exonuclease RecJ [Proteiniclasticum sediminis]